MEFVSFRHNRLIFIQIWRKINMQVGHWPHLSLWSASRRQRHEAAYTNFGIFMDIDDSVPPS